MRMTLVRGFARHAAARRRAAAAADQSHEGLSQSQLGKHHAAPANALPVMGAVNGATFPWGEPDASNLQSEEVWTGISYALASHMMFANLTVVGSGTACIFSLA